MPDVSALAFTAPTTWGEVAAWMTLGSGAALAVGTGAALWRYHRVGAFPGQPAGVDATASRVTGAWVRCAVGVVLVIAGLVWLA